MRQIPQILHFTCASRQISFFYQLAIECVKRSHPGWNIRIYDDEAARSVIAVHFPHLLGIYDAYEFPIQRVDMFRVAVISLFGGFYMDMDIRCLRSLDDLCYHGLALGEEKTISEQERLDLGLKHRLRIANYMFGSMPGHPFWDDVLASMAERSSWPVKSEFDILETTGPGLFTDVYHQVAEKYADIHLLRNKDRECLKKCSNYPSCHFGDYAAHLHEGSWRWEGKNILKNN